MCIKMGHWERKGGKHALVSAGEWSRDPCNWNLRAFTGWNARGWEVSLFKETSEPLTPKDGHILIHFEIDTGNSRQKKWDTKHFHGM